MKCTLVKLTLLVAFEGTEDHIPDASLEALGDQLAEIVRQDDRALTVAAEYDSVEADVPEDDMDAALDQQFPTVPRATASASGDMNEWAPDRCRVCGTVIGAGWRALHVGLCDSCRDVPKS